MKKLSSLLLASAFLVPLAGAGPAGAQTQPASGQVQMTVHTHSAGVLQFPSQRLPYNFTTGSTFAYSSRICSATAPFNDIGLNFTPNYPGVDDNANSAARVRHSVEGTITSRSGNRGTLRGRIRTLLCVQVSGAWVASPNVLVSYFEGQYILAAENDLHVYGGFQFSPTESTGTFRDIQGGGRLEARFTCLGLNSCVPGGEFTDFVASTGDPNLPAGQLQPGLTGSFYDPTVGPIAQPTG
ncbi:MAG TPA: hypothetical protein VMZ73_07290 [Acidimicrobiales bacterium]|nr:hypothetical protein [Acidimicrobiales bacterium]